MQFVQSLTICLVLIFLVENVSADLYKYQNLDEIKGQAGTKRWRRDEKYAGGINNLRGKPGQGYHIEVEVGTPKQTVSIGTDYLYLLYILFLKLVHV